MLFDNIERRKDIRYIVCHTIEYIIETENKNGTIIGLTVNISNSGLCFYTFKTLLKGQEIKIKRTPSLSYHSATVRWSQKVTDNFYKVGLSL